MFKSSSCHRLLVDNKKVSYQCYHNNYCKYDVNIRKLKSYTFLLTEIKK